jgi:hypothetical protein
MTARLNAALVAIFAIAAATSAAASWAGRITLNDTGMTQCIDHQGNWSEGCAKSRQDAAYGRDVDYRDSNDGAAGFSFRKVCRSGEMAGEGRCPGNPQLGGGPDDWGCVFDSVTQLMWETKTTDGGIHDRGHLFTNRGRKARDDQSDAAWLADATNVEALCGAVDWRLPDDLELHSIVHYGMGGPGLNDSYVDTSFFPNTVSWHTWTRTKLMDSNGLWYVSFDNGSIGTARPSVELAVRLVHAGSPPSQNRLGQAERFVISPDGTEVTDTLSGLVWRRCAEGMNWNNQAGSCDGSMTLFYWKDAFDHAKANREGGWRIPNIKELFSIVDHEVDGVPLDPIAFPNVPLSSNFLSSTLIEEEASLYSKWVFFYRGSIDNMDIYKGRAMALRLVRHGRE